MAISIEGITIAYDALGLLVNATATAYADILDLGDKPQFPNYVENDADYNDVLSAQLSWKTNFDAAVRTYNIAKAAQLAQEAAVVALMPQKEWVVTVGLSNWGSATTQVIATPIITPECNPINDLILFTITSAPNYDGGKYPNLS